MAKKKPANNHGVVLVPALEPYKPFSVNGVIFMVMPDPVLYADQDLQRKWRMTPQFRAMIAAFSYYDMKVLVVSGYGFVKDGNFTIGMEALKSKKLHIVDGNTRREARLRNCDENGLDKDGKPPLYLVLFDPRSPGEAFLEQNSKCRRVADADRFRIALNDRRPEEVYIYEWYKSHGVLIITDNAPVDGVNICRQPGALKYAYNRLGQKRFTDMSNLLVKAFVRPDGEGSEIQSLTAAFIKGLTQFMTSTSASNAELLRGLTKAPYGAACILKLAVKNKPPGTRRSDFDRWLRISNEIDVAWRLGMNRR